MRITRALGGGVAGAVTVTLINEIARRTIPHAPRLDALGMRALAATLRGAGGAVPDHDTLFYETLAGDLLSNSLYYSLVGFGGARGAWLRGALLGLAAGVGAALLPPKVGLGHQPGERAPDTQLMTVAWYTLGGLAAAAVAGRFAGAEASRARREPALARGDGEGI